MLDVNASQERKQGETPEGQWLSVRELAHELNIGKNLAYRIAHRVPHARVGGLIRIRRSDLEHALLEPPGREGRPEERG